MNSLSKYSRTFFESLLVKDLQFHLTEFENLLNKVIEDTSDINLTLKEIVEMLKSIGHDLYSLDYDSDINRLREVWGSNYHDQTTNGLEIEFVYPGKTKVLWAVSSSPFEKNLS